MITGKYLVLFSFLTLIGLLVASYVSKNEYAKVQGALQQQQQKNQELEDANLALENDIASLQAELEVSQTELMAVKNENNELSVNIQNLDDTLIENEITFNNEQEELADAKRTLDIYADTLGINVYSNIQPPYSKAENNPVHLIRNRRAVDPTWEELVSFIQSDKTDSLDYIEGIRMCGGFAEEVFNNAELAEIKAAFVAVHFTGCDLAHALNAFYTTDRGLVYIDCTGSEEPGYSCDKMLAAASFYRGNEYLCTPLFEENHCWYSMGKIESIEIYW